MARSRAVERSLVSELVARVLVAGEGEGPVLACSEPLSLWGGLDPDSGLITDVRHPQSGESVTGKVVLLPWGRGSSSASSILLEAVRTGTAPVAIITSAPDPILALGAVVALELYGRSPAVLVVESEEWEQLGDVERLRFDREGRLVPVSE